MRTAGMPGGLKGRRVTVVGLGRFGGGVGVTRWLCAQGARVTVSDLATADALAGPLAQLQGLDLTLRLGGHDPGDLRNADLLVVNPAVPKDSPLVRLADAEGIPRTSEINLFLERCPATVVGVTGSVGKSTTAALTAAMLARARTVHLGGNIGGSLLGDLQAIRPDDVVVLELSSFQLEDTPLVGISPPVAVVTNLAPNHLDRHGNMEAYAAAKRNIFRFRNASGLLILNAACDATRPWAADAPGRVELFTPIPQEPFELRVPGAHNQANAQAAWTAAREFGVTRRPAADAALEFTGLPHRLQLVAEIDGVRCFNDSKCTTPQGTIVALEAFGPRTAVVIVGGYDKGVSFAELGRALADGAKAVVAIGATAGAIAEQVELHRTTPQPPILTPATFEQAVALARRLAAPGDAVLLSPACASFDMFDNYEHRGQRFIELIR